MKLATQMIAFTVVAIVFLVGLDYILSTLVN